MYSCTTILQELLRSGDIISGVVANDDLCVCVQGQGSDPRIHLHPINFSDDGLWFYNLWYSKASSNCETNTVSSVDSRKELTDLASDYFVMMPMGEDQHANQHANSDDDYDDNADDSSDDDEYDDVYGNDDVSDGGVDINNDNEDCCYTVLCQSWRIRNSEGKLALPTPSDDIFSN